MEPVARVTRVGAYAVCERDGALLLVRFTRSGMWTLPGGGLDHGEDPRAAAVREVEEETGLQVVLGPVLDVRSTVWERTDDGARIDVHALYILYRGEVAAGALRHEIGGSSDQAAWVPLAEVPGLSHTGVVDEAMDAAGLR